MESLRRLLQRTQSPLRRESDYALVSDAPSSDDGSLESQQQHLAGQFGQKSSHHLLHYPRARGARVHVALLYLTIALLGGFLVVRDPALPSLKDFGTPSSTTSATTSLDSVHGLSSSIHSWSKSHGRRAYAQYVTNEVYLCNAIIMYERLKRFNTTAEFALTFPKGWEDVTMESSGDDKRIPYLMNRARALGVNFHPYDPIQTPEANGFYLDVNNKFSIFNLTDYERIVYMDSDALVFHSLDDLFDLPSTPLALTRAYWSPSRPNWLTSALMVVEPSTPLYDRAIAMLPGHENYLPGSMEDMEIVNRIADGWALLIPHRHLFMLSMDFRDGFEDPTHQRYLRQSQSGDKWDPELEYEKIRLVHFSEGGPKPWYGHDTMDPLCAGREDAGCMVWRKIMDEYLTTVEEVCRVPARIP